MAEIARRCTGGLDERSIAERGWHGQTGGVREDQRAAGRDVGGMQDNTRKKSILLDRAANLDARPLRVGCTSARQVERRAVYGSGIVAVPEPQGGSGQF